MRHGKKDNHLGRTNTHRKAMLANMANSLILSKRIETTVAKAKELRKYVEPLITRGKEDTTSNRRLVFSYLQDKESIKSLFGEIAEKVASRNGGYTRIIKLGARQGDAAETCMIEFVDYNANLLSVGEEKATKTRRSRRGGSGAKKNEGDSSAEVVETAPVVAPVVEAAAPVVEENIAEVETPAAETTSESEEEKA